MPTYSIDPVYVDKISSSCTVCSFQQLHSLQPLFRAAYEYVSQDTDEVSFVEGDIISNGLPIDEGWMYGLVERTGAYGMMPSNYVTPL